MKKSQSPEFEFVNEQDKKEFEEIPKAEQKISMKIFNNENKNGNKSPEKETKKNRRRNDITRNGFI